jgi:alpha-galactosidase
MKGFVSSVHKLGMKFILWYSVPYVGDKSDNYRRFKGKYLDYWSGEWGGSYTLDPRYPDVREFLITTYESALKEWDLDGFKLDFVDNFVARKDTVLSTDDGRDYASVNRAFDRLMTDIKKRLTAIKPDILIEFRQPYIGPLMRKYGNMFRAGDCPGSYLMNRVRIADLRLLSGNTAVHSDMVMWHPEEPVESAALQMTSILFSVPQLSVRLDRLPKSHLEMIDFWTAYWQKNQSILLDGTFMPVHPSSNYPEIRSRSGGRAIIGLYDDRVLTIPGELEEVSIVNGKLTPDVILEFSGPVQSAEVMMRDCTGKTVKKCRMDTVSGMLKLKAPLSGLIQIGKMN